MTPYRNEQKEIWKSTMGGILEASSLGRIRRMDSGFIYSTPINNNRGYRHGHISVKGKHRCFRVHRLVAEAFSGPCPPGLHVNHKDGDKLNNRPENLEYITAGDNNRHAMRIGLFHHGERCSYAKLKDVDVVEIRRLIKLGDLTGREIAAVYDVSESNISQISLGQIWRHVL